MHTFQVINSRDLLSGDTLQTIVAIQSTPAKNGPFEKKKDKKKSVVKVKEEQDTEGVAVGKAKASGSGTRANRTTNSLPPELTDFTSIFLPLWLSFISTLPNPLGFIGVDDGVMLPVFEMVIKRIYPDVDLNKVDIGPGSSAWEVVSKVHTSYNVSDCIYTQASQRVSKYCNTCGQSGLEAVFGMFIEKKLGTLEARQQCAKELLEREKFLYEQVSIFSGSCDGRLPTSY